MNNRISKTRDITMNIFERGLSAVFASGQHGRLSEMSNSDGKDCKQQLKYLWPGRFV